MTHPEPPYLRIVNEIRGRIAAGQLRPGDRVPSTRQLTQDYGVAMATATKVLTTLRQQGLVTTRPGAGTLVATPTATSTETPTEMRTATTAPTAQPTTAPEAPATPQTRRRDQPPPAHALTRDKIVGAAIGIADTEGIAAVSMRRLATELEAATMSLYHHVEGRDELTLLMADALFAETTLPTQPPAGWRAQLELAARAQWTLYRQHPWLARTISITRPDPLPNAIQHTEWVLRALDGLGLDHTTAFYLHLAVLSHVRGTAINLESEAEAVQHTGLTDDEWIDTQGEAFTRILDNADLPAFTTALAGFQAEGGFDFNLDTLFEFGLQRLLDGLATFLAQPDPRVRPIRPGE